MLDQTALAEVRARFTAVNAEATATIAAYSAFLDVALPYFVATGAPQDLEDAATAFAQRFKSYAVAASTLFKEIPELLDHAR